VDPGFQVRGGALKKIAPSEGRREIFLGISCEKSRFYAKKNHIFPILGGGARIFWGISCEKSPESATVTEVLSKVALNTINQTKQRKNEIYETSRQKSLQ
jgi:hypothetical protein